MKNALFLLLLILPCLLYSQKRLNLDAGYTYPKFYDTDGSSRVKKSISRPSYLIDISFQNKKSTALYPKFALKYQNSSSYTSFNFGASSSGFDVIEINIHSCDFSFLIEYSTSTNVVFFANIGSYISYPFIIKQSGFSFRNSNSYYFLPQNIDINEYDTVQRQNYHLLLFGLQASSGILTDITDRLSVLLSINYTYSISDIGSGMKLNILGLNVGVSRLIN